MGITVSQDVRIDTSERYSRRPIQPRRIGREAVPPRKSDDPTKVIVIRGVESGADGGQMLTAVSYAPVSAPSNQRAPHRIITVPITVQVPHPGTGPEIRVVRAEPQVERALTPDERVPTPDERSPTPDAISPTPDERVPTPDVRSPTPDERSPTPDERSPTPDERSPTPDERAPTPDERAPTPDERAPTPGERVPTPDERSPTPDERSPTPDERVPTPDERSPTPDERVPTPDERSPTPDERAPTPDERGPSPDERSFGESQMGFDRRTPYHVGIEKSFYCTASNIQQRLQSTKPDIETPQGPSEEVQHADLKSTGNSEFVLNSEKPNVCLETPVRKTIAEKNSSISPITKEIIAAHGV